jgi:glucokinase
VRGDETGTITEHISFPTESALGAEPLYAKIAGAIRDFRTSKTRAAGVAIGGPLDAKHGIILNAPHLPFLDFPLLERLRADCALPVLVHHDAAACALAESRWGPDAGASGIAYLTCGTGFGVGLVLDGRVRYGSSGHSPEIGHIRYREDGPDIFSKRGCFEGFGSASALLLLARERDPAGLGRTTPAEILERARAAEPLALEIFRENARAVGAACSLLADLLVLDVVALGSLSQYGGEEWIAWVRETFETEALPANVATCRLRAAMPSVQDLSGLAAAVDAAS